MLTFQVLSSLPKCIADLFKMDVCDETEKEKKEKQINKILAWLL